MTRNRIYVVGVVDGIAVRDEHLVRAQTKTQAKVHVSRNTIEARVATQDDLVRLTREGLRVEEASPGSE